MSRSKIFGNIKVFSRKKLRKYTHSSSTLIRKSKRDIIKTDINEDSESFRRNSKDSGLVSTQQIPLDNSNFANNTFFGSAEVKVNIAFDKIINKYPFDGSFGDVEKFEDELSSFEKHVLDSFPKSRGFVRFTGAQYIETKDSTGFLNQNLSSGNLGNSRINPKEKSFSIELHVYLSKAANNNSYLFYCLDEKGTNNYVGFSSFLKATSSAATAEIGFLISSGSVNSVISSSFSKGEWHNIHFICDRRQNFNNISISKVTSGNFLSLKESNQILMGDINTESTSLFIGKGNSIAIPNFSFDYQENFKGYLDEFRLFHNLRSRDEIEFYSKRNIFSHENLRICYRFNEPSGSYSNNNIVLDHSGNSLHSKVESFSHSSNKTNFEPGVSNPIVLENSKYSPILFPKFNEVVDLNNNLLNEASEYDINNPNLITKMIPKHYLNIGSDFEGVAVDGEMVESYSSTSNLPRTGKLGSNQLMSLLLYFFAEEFDSYKVFLDQVSQYLHPDYENKSGVANPFLSDLADYYGFDLPDIFSDATYEQYLGSESLGLELGIYERNIQEIQNIIWRRILKNLNYINKTKGTKESIKSIFRSAGIEPDRMFRMVEFGGKKEFRMGKSRQKIVEMATMLDFSGSLSYKPIESILSNGMLLERPYIISAHLTGTRIEPGLPEIAGGNALAKGTIKFHSSNNSLIPANGSTVTIRDAFSKQKTFQFTDGGGASGDNVEIDRRNRRTTHVLAALTASINSHFSDSLSVTSFRSSPGSNIDTIQLVSKNFSRNDLGNHTISGTGTHNLTFNGFAGGNGFIRAGNIGYEPTGISTTESDGLLTSGSWSVEGVYKFEDNIQKEIKRSLSRLALSGTQSSNVWEHKTAITSNLVLSDKGESLKLYVRSSSPSSSPVLEIDLTGSNINLLNGKKWYVCYGRKRNDLIGQELSSSYFVRVGNFDSGRVQNFYEVEKSFYEGDPNKNVFQTTTPSGGTTYTPHFVLIGSQSFQNGNQGQFLNDSSTVGFPIHTKTSYFDGKVAGIKFWSKALSQEESLEHIKNFKSVGTDNPKTNNTFAITNSGSFEKLRLNVSTDQIEKNSNILGQLNLVDFSQNFAIKSVTGSFHSVSGAMCQQFDKGRKIIKEERFDYSIISPFYDENIDDDRVKIAGFSDGENIKLYNARTAPVYELEPFETEINDNRFEIQIHLQRGLDEDIMNIFSSIESLDNALGRPELAFTIEYPDLKRLRSLYFNRLTDKVNYKNFFDLFRWLDDVFSDTVEKLIPRNTDFLGINIIIESHALERTKIAYKHFNVYNAPDTRSNLDSVLLVSQRSGIIRRF